MQGLASWQLYLPLGQKGLEYKDQEITSLADIQRLPAKDLHIILRSHSELPGGTKADLVLKKVFALLIREMSPSAANSEESESSGQSNDSTMRRISALGWLTDLRNLLEMNFVQLYDYIVVSMHKYCHIVTKGTNYKKLKSYQFFFKGNVNKLECKNHDNKKYVRANVLPSIKMMPYRVVIEFSPTCDVLRTACTCPAGLGLQGKGKCNHVGGVLFAIEDFSRIGLPQNPEPRNQSVAAKPLDKVLIRKIRFGKKNIRTQANIIKFDRRAPQQQTREPESFKKLCNNCKIVCLQVHFFSSMTLN